MLNKNIVVPILIRIREKIDFSCNAFRTHQSKWKNLENETVLLLLTFYVVLLRLFEGIVNYEAPLLINDSMSALPMQYVDLSLHLKIV